MSVPLHWTWTSEGFPLCVQFIGRYLAVSGSLRQLG